MEFIVARASGTDVSAKSGAFSSHAASRGAQAGASSDQPRSKHVP